MLLIVFVWPGEVNVSIIEPEQVLEESKPNFTLMLVPDGLVSFQFNVAATKLLTVPLPVY